MRSHLEIAAVAAAVVLSTLTSRAAEPLRDRREFAAAISKVNEGMSADDVLKLLGKPDDVITRRDTGFRDLYGSLEIWRYGTAGHLRPATLGQITISEKHRVERIIGQGMPGPTPGLSEVQLRQFIEAIANVNTYAEGNFFNPRPLIRAVNLLQPVGKDAALAALEEFLRITPHRFADRGDAAMLVMHVLFDVPNEPTIFPGGVVGEPGCMPPIFGYADLDGMKATPRFPIAIEGGIPFLAGQIVGFSRLSSKNAIPDADQHLAYFRKYGTIRREKLVPSDHPFDVLDSYLESPRWPKPSDADENPLGLRGFVAFLLVPFAVIGVVVLILVRLVGRGPLAAIGLGGAHQGRTFLGGAFVGLAMVAVIVAVIWAATVINRTKIRPHHDPVDQAWLRRSEKGLKQQAVRLIDTVFWTYSDSGMLDDYGDPTHLEIRWDRDREMYTYLDGSTLPDPVRYRRHTWQPFPSPQFEVIVERNTARLISASVPYCCCGSSDPEVRSAIIRVFNVKSRDKSIFVLRPGCDSGQGAKLDEGEEIQAEATLAGKKQLSPVFMP